ncbi:hypothetical protein Tco_0747060 [Tanacetum coccineum]
MIKAAAGWYETTSLRHPPLCGSNSGSKPPSYANASSDNSGSNQLSRTHEWLECEKVRGGLLSVEQSSCPLWCRMTRHNLVEVVAPRHPSLVVTVGFGLGHNISI